jgi:hypothetical protein
LLERRVQQKYLRPSTKPRTPPDIPSLWNLT